ncbi:hypothetical protein [Clostridium amazonitimonense]|uniref:hypothetical protein n=1 Tax=Clostridium amazonitimonense TaxID=1499689 RepID=UPI0005095FDB|nr:hypothetical protein [Clostridium amazonitimonense]
MDNETKNRLFDFTVKTLLIILFIILCFVTFKYWKVKNSKSIPPPLEKVLDEINSYNKSISAVFHTKDETINNNDMNIYVDKLKLTEKNLKELDLKASHNKDNILNGLHNNILFYEQIKILLENSNSKDFNDSLKNVDEYKRICIEEYLKCNFNQSKDNFPKSTIEYINNSYLSFNNAIKLKRDMDIKNDHNTDFKRSLASISERFLNIKIDKSNFIEKCRNGEYAYEVLQSEIEREYKVFEDLRKEFNSLKIPPNAIESYKAFNDVLNSYNLYAKELKRNVNNEKQVFNNNSVDKNVLSLVNEELSSKIEDLNNDLERFNSIFKNFSDEISFNK